jgi:hypothetical protein
VLGAAVRLVDLGFLRPGGEEYAEENGTFGLAAIRKGSGGACPGSGNVLARD